MMNSGEKEVHHQERGVPDVVGKGSADSDGGVQNEIEGCKSRPRSADRD
jgi:hypothetical protein